MRALTLSLAATTSFWGADLENIRKIPDVLFAEADGHPLRLDLYLPADAQSPPLVVYVHGGAWRAGSRKSMPLGRLVQSGFAVASVDYRLTPVARFPAQVHDIKAAIRFLRGRAGDYGYDARRIAIAGSSAGGHLAALVGVTNGDSSMEGRVGDDLDRQSDVQAIVSYYGASNFLTILEQSTPHGLGVRIPALQLLLGAQPEDAPELAKAASPLYHVDADDPPLLLLHGDQDPQMPVNQSLELAGKYENLGLPVSLEIVNGSSHGGPAFYDTERTALVARFLRQHLAVSEP